MTSPRIRALPLLTRITYLRIGAVPVVMALVLMGDRVRHAFAAAAVVFLLAAMTDFLDGYLARRWNLTTTLGAFLDTTADKLLVSGALIALVAVDRASSWIALVVIGRELVIMGLRGVAAAAGTIMKPSIWGKMKASAQFGAIALAIVRYPHRVGPLFIDEWAMIAAAGITVMSAVEYLVRFFPVLKTPSSGGGTIESAPPPRNVDGIE
jgi:CDP-diacylglycerol--glycerol-3-phosphate 3-phosphatidyltransferase